MPLDIPSPTAYSPPGIVPLDHGERGSVAAPPGNISPPIPPRAFRKRIVFEARSSDPLTDYSAKLAAQSWVQQRIKVQIEERVRELRIDALLSSERFSEASLRDFRAFLEPLVLANRPSIFLLDNGNLRALWKNAAKEQVGLQFLGGGVVQFVMFVQRRDPPIMSRDAGLDAVSAIRARIKANDGDRLLFG